MTDHDNKIKKSNYNIASRVLHSSYPKEQITGSVNVPIYATSTYEQSAPGEHLGYDYSRSHNPSRFAYEHAIAELESGASGYAFSSGMAAINTILDLLDNGAHIVVSDDVYGGTYRLMHHVKQRTHNLKISWVDFTDLSAIAAAINDDTAMLWVETPSNPMLKIVDLSAVATLANACGALMVVDNTFATPILQRPLEYGADIVVHSATKYLNGHCDVVNGAVVVGENYELAERMTFLQNSSGAICSPFDSFLVLRGMKTLALRVQQQCTSALHIAKALSGHPLVESVIYPGLSSHPGHDIAKSQMAAFGGIVSIDMKGGLDKVRSMLTKLDLFTLAESLGGVTSLIEHPGIMTHASIPTEQREALGISDGLLRLSIGIEHVDDLLSDLLQAIGT